MISGSGGEGSMHCDTGFIAVIRACRFLLASALLCLAGNLAAQEPLKIVTDTWAPYAMEVEGKPAGTDVDVVLAVFERLHIPVTLHFVPWQRALDMLAQKQADAILDVSLTEDRRRFIEFPEEPVSTGVTTIFVRANRDLAYTDLASLGTLHAAAIIGYSYCEEIDSAAFMHNAERLATLEQSFGMLMAERVDFVVEVDAVGYHMLRAMGLQGQAKSIPEARYCHGGNYLGFARKTGFKQLARAFSTELKVFKTTQEYRRIQDAYGVSMD